MESLLKLAQEHQVELAVTTRLESEAKHEETLVAYRELIESGTVQVIGATFRLNHSRLGGPDTLVDEGEWKRIARAVFPNRNPEIMFRPKGNLPPSSLDIDHLYGHLRAERDYFVTRDKKIIRAKIRLASLGIKVCTPEQMVKAAKP